MTEPREKHIVTFYPMSESELMSAKILAEPTLRMIKNLHATDFMKLNNLQPDPNNYPKYIQEHAELKGSIAAWQLLIDEHEETVARLNVG
jgi:hypothetical protein